MSHLRVIRESDSAPPPHVYRELSERMHEARNDGSIEAALHIWGLRVRASRGADVAWRTTRPDWHRPGRLDNWWSPVWLPTAEEHRHEAPTPFSLASLFDSAA